jgi:hypothetical protein
MGHPKIKKSSQFCSKLNQKSKELSGITTKFLLQMSEDSHCVALKGKYQQQVTRAAGLAGRLCHNRVKTNLNSQLYLNGLLSTHTVSQDIS